MANPRGAPVQYDDGAMLATLDRASTGDTLVAIAKALGVSVVTIWRRRKDDHEFDAALERAITEGAFCRLDGLRDELDAYLCNGGAASTAKARMDLFKFWLEKRLPATFAPRQQVDMNITIDLAGSIQRAQQRALTSAQVIDLTATSVTLASDTISVAKPK